MWRQLETGPLRIREPSMPTLSCGQGGNRQTSGGWPAGCPGHDATTRKGVTRPREYAPESRTVQLAIGAQHPASGSRIRIFDRYV